MAPSWALSHPQCVGLQIGMALGRRAPQLMMGMLWEGRMWRSRGDWDGLNILVLLQTDLRRRGCREQLSAWHASICGSRFGLCVPPLGSRWVQESAGVSQT